MDPWTLVADEIRKNMHEGVRMSGPILAQAGMISAINRWGGRPTDSLARLATLLGLHGTWINNTRAWLDEPARHHSLTVVAGAMTSLLILSLAYRAGTWASQQEKVSRLCDATQDEADQRKIIRRDIELTVARIQGTGTSIWFGIALLLELAVMSLFVVVAGAVFYIITALSIHIWTRLQESEPLELGWAALSLGAAAGFTLIPTLFSPELRLLNVLTVKPQRA